MRGCWWREGTRLTPKRFPHRVDDPHGQHERPRRCPAETRLAVLRVAEVVEEAFHD